VVIRSDVASYESKRGFALYWWVGAVDVFFECCPCWVKQGFPGRRCYDNLFSARVLALCGVHLYRAYKHFEDVLRRAEEVLVVNILGKYCFTWCGLLLDGSGGCCCTIDVVVGGIIPAVDLGSAVYSGKCECRRCETASLQ